MSAATTRRVLVTGGTGAIGGAVVERLRAEGAELAFSGRNLTRGTELAGRTGATFVPGDVRESGAVSAIVAEALGVLGGLDGLVLATGVLHRSPLSETTDAAWDALIETNVVAPVLFARACLDALSDGGGAIVAIASGVADWPEAELGAYSVSKRALLWMTRMLAVEGASRGVRANAVCPGHTAVGMSSVVNGADPLERPPPVPPSGGHATAAEAAEGVGLPPPTQGLPPTGRCATAAEVAEAVAYLLSDAAAGSTGAALSVDGGMLAALSAARVRQ
ncbi:MAG: SDR family oxidoreductase [bacterium]|nr:SDR family oxidoreductase [bacterium]